MKTHGWIPAIMASLLVLQACGKEASTPPAHSETDRDAAPAPVPSDSGTDAEPPGSTNLADYDQTCATNRDCMLTFDGPCPEGACWCVDAAIPQAQQEAYTKALIADAQSRACNSLGRERCKDTCAADLVALCTDGRCVAEPKPADPDLGTYDRSCTTVADCVVVSTDRCYCNPCRRDAIARSALAQYEAEVAELPACGTQAPCDTSEACNFGGAICEGGLCGYQVTGGPP